MASRFRVYNGAAPTTAKFVAVTTGTAIKTMLQLKPFNFGKIIAWGISFDGSAAATPIPVELIETGTVFATVTAHVDAGCVKMGGADQAAASVAGLTMGTSATGYTSTAEGTITTSRLFGAHQISPAQPDWSYQFPLGQEPWMVIGNALRIRVHAGAAVNCICWIDCEF